MKQAILKISASKKRNYFIFVFILGLIFDLRWIPTVRNFFQDIAWDDLRGALLLTSFFVVFLYVAGIGITLLETLIKAAKHKGDLSRVKLAPAEMNHAYIDSPSTLPLCIGAMVHYAGTLIFLQDISSLLLLYWHGAITIFVCLNRWWRNQLKRHQKSAQADEMETS